MSASKNDHVAKASEALSDLNIFYAVVGLLEGGTVHLSSYGAQKRIIKICKNETRKRLLDYDRARARAKKELQR